MRGRIHAGVKPGHGQKTTAFGGEDHVFLTSSMRLPSGEEWKPNMREGERIEGIAENGLYLPLAGMSNAGQQRHPTGASFFSRRFH